MSFSKEWEERHKANKNISIWPWSDLVSYVMRYARPSSLDFRVLELGCGAGANILFFKGLGVQYYAIEGSSLIVERLLERFPELKGNIVVGDFTEDIPFSEPFDLIVDRASLTSNSTPAISGALKIVYDKLKKDGIFIGIDWYSTSHSDYELGDVVDNYTRCNIQQGQFTGLGKVHFSDKTYLLNLFSNFKVEILEHKTIKREIPDDNHVFASWNLVAKKVGA
jgi:SAM-dependent methyltransferase